MCVWVWVYVGVCFASFTEEASVVPYLSFFSVEEIFSDGTRPKISYTNIFPVQRISPLKFYNFVGTYTCS